MKGQGQVTENERQTRDLLKDYDIDQKTINKFFKGQGQVSVRAENDDGRNERTRRREKNAAEQCAAVAACVEVSGGLRLPASYWRRAWLIR
jgi:16S rRNA C1402 (ribose-2'-O) methylase RsmI